MAQATCSSLLFLTSVVFNHLRSTSPESSFCSPQQRHPFSCSHSSVSLLVFQRRPGRKTPGSLPGVRKTEELTSSPTAPSAICSPLSTPCSGTAGVHGIRLRSSQARRVLTTDSRGPSSCRLLGRDVNKHTWDSCLIPPEIGNENKSEGHSDGRNGREGVRRKGHRVIKNTS